MPLKFELCPGRMIGANYPCFIIAEIGQNHQGDIELAKKMIKMAKVNIYTNMQLKVLFVLNNWWFWTSWVTIKLTGASSKISHFKMVSYLVKVLFVLCDRYVPPIKGLLPFLRRTFDSLNSCNCTLHTHSGLTLLHFDRTVVLIVPSSRRVSCNTSSTNAH